MTASDADDAGPTATRPNILLILADDLGYSDIHAFGGEIDTPNLDALVQNGRVLTNHHVGTVSAITRSMLISGTDHHRVGEGTMGAPTDERRGLPGYEGYLNDSALSIAQLLHDAGYHTYMAGKWHLGSGVSSSSNTNLGKAPNLWGFDRSFALLGGGASNHFVHEQANSQNYEEDGQYVQPGQPNQPSGYDDDIYTSKLMSYIDSNDGDGKPFFAYAAYTAPHWPLQAPDPYLNKYSGKYSQGYDAIRNARIALQQSEGIFPPSLLPYPGAPETTSESPATANYGKSSALYISAIHFPPDYVDYRAGIFDKQWATLSAAEQAAQARYMEVYAGMVAYLDYDIGLLIQHLKDIGHYDDTFIIFHSDNGAEGWPLDNGADPTKTDTANGQPSVIPTLGTDNGQTNANRLQYGLRWAEVSATPFAQSKGYSGEGGVSVPAIVHLPGQTASLPPITQFTHVIDDSATFLDLAGVAPPSTPAPPNVNSAGVDQNAGKVVYAGRNVYPITGQSFLPLLEGSTAQVHTAPFGDEGYGRAYIYSADGQWKLRWTEPPFGPLDGHWELFDIVNDRGETTDVSAQNPDVVSALFADWQSYMTSVGGVEPVHPLGYY